MAERIAIELLYNRKKAKFWIIELVDDTDTSNKYIQKRHYTGRNGKIVSVVDFSSEDFNETFSSYEKKILAKIKDVDFRPIRNGASFPAAPEGLLGVIKGGLPAAREEAEPQATKAQYRKIKIDD